MQPASSSVFGRGMMAVRSVFSRRYWTVSTERDNRLVVLTDNTDVEKRLIFPSIWLRDNCQCPGCFEAASNSRIINMKLFNYKVQPTQTKITNTLQLQVAWSDDHQSNFSMEWLKERNFHADTQNSYLRRNYKFERKPWSAENFPDVFKTYDYEAIITNDKLLLDWLTNLTTYGATLIENAGTQLDTLKTLASRVAFLRRTQYGETFRVEARDDATNTAYKSWTLQLHVDLPYNRYMPELLLLHCICQSKVKYGGESELTDCLHVAQEIKKNNPAAYHRLRSIDVDWSDIGEDNGYHFHTIYREPVIREDKDGEIQRINFSQPQRDTHFNIPAEEVDSWYEAWSMLVQELYSPKNKVAFKLKEGDILVFDNTRLVHGRTGFDDSRLLIGGYMDWDLAHSRLRILRKQLHM